MSTLNHINPEITPDGKVICYCKDINGRINPTDINEILSCIITADFHASLAQGRIVGTQVFGIELPIIAALIQEYQRRTNDFPRSVAMVREVFGSEPLTLEPEDLTVIGHS